jgi:hypothetical protein
MNSLLSIASSKLRYSASRYRWVIVWLGIGCAIAILLLANAVRDYVFVSRLLATQQVRHQMTQIAAQIEQLFASRCSDLRYSPKRIGGQLSWSRVDQPA